jgi:CelD/BcsL family acetyltransferase involved in cellulose biosynthesis
MQCSACKPDAAWRAGRVVWTDMFGRSSTATAFVSSEWVAAWLGVYAAALHPTQLVVTESTGAIAGTCLLTASSRGVAGILWRRLHLNTDGEPEPDSVIVEHNMILAGAALERSATRAVAQWVKAAKVDEFVAAGVGSDELARLTEAFGGWTVDVEWRVAPFVNLEALRSGARDHLSAVGASTRARLRKSRREYESRGALTVGIAETSVEALELFREMVRLHEQRWSNAGHVGAFASRKRREFHERFIRSSVASGRAHLLRVACGGQTVGILYNLQANGRVSFYQSGFAYSSDERLSPGMLSHHLAIEHYRVNGYMEYDFLASGTNELRYKRSLATDERRLAWAAMTRPGPRANVLQLLRRLRRAAHFISKRRATVRAVAQERT